MKVGNSDSIIEHLAEGTSADNWIVNLACGAMIFLMVSFGSLACYEACTSRNTEVRLGVTVDPDNNKRKKKLFDFRNWFN